MIYPNYLNTAVDRCIMRAAVQRLLKTVHTNPRREVSEEEEVVPPGFSRLRLESSDEEIDKRIRACAVGWWHGAGTATMGNVVNTSQKVKGLEGLRVVDASVLPVPTAAHYQAAIYALSEQVADVIAEEGGN